MDLAITAHAKGFRKMVWGQYFYFGHDEKIANSRVAALLSYKLQLEADGATAWTENTKAIAKTIAKGKATAPQIDSTALGFSKASEPQPKKSKPPELQTEAKTANVVMSHDVIDGYLTFCQNDPIKKHQHGFFGRVIALKRSLPQVPLNELGEKQLDQLVSYWKARPKGMKTIKNKKTKQWEIKPTATPISAQSVKSYIGVARQCFKWVASKSSGYNWQSPNLQSIFEFRNAEMSRLSTPAQLMQEIRKKHDVALMHFSTSELKQLWQASHNNLRRKLFFLLSLNIGAATSELAGLLVGHCFIDGEHKSKPFISFFRPKTKVFGTWYLWDDTAKYLRQYLKPQYPHQWVDDLVNGNKKRFIRNGIVWEPYHYENHRKAMPTELNLKEWNEKRAKERKCWEDFNWKTNLDDNVFLTDEGNLLFEINDKGHRNDAVKTLWKRWAKTADVQRLSWKYMRKTASQLVRQAATDLGLNGDYISEIFLAHKAPVMSRPYNERDATEYQQLRRVLMEVRKRIQPIFDDE